MANRSPIAPRVAPAPRTTSALASVSPLRQTLTGRPPTGGRRQAKRAGCPITRRRPSLSARQFWAQRARPGVRAASIARDAPPLRARNTASQWPTISALKTKDYGSRPPHPLAGGNAEGDTLSLVRAASLDECDPGAAGLPRSRASTPWWPSLSTLPLQYAHPVPTGPTGSCHVRGAEKESTWGGASLFHPLQYPHPVPTGPTGSCHVRGGGEREYLELASTLPSSPVSAPSTDRADRLVLRPPVEGRKRVLRATWVGAGRLAGGRAPLR